MYEAYLILLVCWDIRINPGPVTSRDFLNIHLNVCSLKDKIDILERHVLLHKGYNLNTVLCGNADVSENINLQILKSIPQFISLTGRFSD